MSSGPWCAVFFVNVAQVRSHEVLGFMGESIRRNSEELGLVCAECILTYKISMGCTSGPTSSVGEEQGMQRLGRRFDSDVGPGVLAFVQHFSPSFQEVIFQRRVYRKDPVTPHCSVTSSLCPTESRLRVFKLFAC
ncbi:hypothetical protein C8Q74DRAFT_1243401 [Fomes fomentarius]|nr:hypothetical protein C8Q74DRAFT_1243401 [Fomes fomentarius]